MEDPARIDRPEDTGSRLESGEAIVVGAIGSAASWFLTGWAHDVEIEFMIDTGCQVTILSTTVFQRMCTMNPAMRSSLQPCRRQLVSVGIWMVYVAVAPTSIDPRPRQTLDDISPPDSEIVVKFSVSGIRPHGNTLV